MPGMMEKGAELLGGGKSRTTPNGTKNGGSPGSNGHFSEADSSGGGGGGGGGDSGDEHGASFLSSCRQGRVGPSLATAHWLAGWLAATAWGACSARVQKVWRERARERDWEVGGRGKCERVYVCLCVYVCACERARARDRLGAWLTIRLSVPREEGRAFSQWAHV